ncbi:MAG TPA: hypothetical protein VGC57_04975 [Cellulomonas sp.]
MSVTPTVRRTVLRTAVLTCAAALALTGCSGGAGDDEEKGSTGAAEYQPGPLDEYTARIYGYSFDPAEQQTQEEAQAESDRKNREVEEFVATCMREEGFDYTPVENNGGTVTIGDDLDVDWGTVEFAQQYGYGISTDPWGMDEQASAEEPVEYVDPNQDYVEAMSDGEREAYEAALWGTPPEIVEGEEDSYEYDWTTAGCQGAAQHEVWEVGGADVGDYSALEQEMNDRYQQLTTSAEVTALQAEWASCMADEGIDGLTTVDEAQQPLYDEWNSLQGWDDPDYLATQESWDWEAKPEGPPAPEVDEAAQAAFTEKEITQAVADFGCQQTIDYQARYTEIDHTDQQAFVDLHRDELEAWAEAATAARGE